MTHELSCLSDFNSLKQTKALLIIDFYAVWCGPCKQISPLFDKLATKFGTSRVQFAKCDVDKQGEIAQICGISAMPTFQFYCNGKKVDEMKGASGPTLERKIAQHVAAVKDTTSGTRLGAEATMQASPSVSQGIGSLRDYIHVETATMLNASSRSTIKSIVRPSFAGAAVDSASGPGLLLYLPLKETKADLTTVKITVNKNELKHAPAKVHVAPNLTSPPADMNALAKAEAVQTFTLFTDEYTDGVAMLTLKKARFQGVKDVAVLIESNLGNEAITKIGQIELIGGRV